MNTISYGLLIALAIALLIAAFTDFRSRTIGNWLTFGIALTATVVGKALNPYSPALLLTVVAFVCAGALVLTVAAIAGIEARCPVAPMTALRPTRFLDGLAEVWRESRARDFTVFVFLSMVAYFMQELILEPFTGLVFAYTPGQSTTLSGAQNGGVFCGMLLVGIAVTGLRIGSLRFWVVAGCLGSALTLVAIALSGMMAVEAVVLPAVVLLGVFNGMFAVAAIGAMMALAGEGRSAREGTRMGLWGASQAMAAGFGGLAGAALVDIGRLLAEDAAAFGAVFVLEAGLFVEAAAMALKTIDGVQSASAASMVPGE